jgi:hypothetical protein
MSVEIWLEMRKNQYVPGIAAYVSLCARICTHSYKGHNPWHTV